MSAIYSAGFLCKLVIFLNLCTWKYILNVSVNDRNRWRAKLEAPLI